MMRGQENEPREGCVSISAIIPFSNALPFLEACAGSLQLQIKSFPTAQIIFADAASTDGSADFLANRFPGFQLVRVASRNAYVARNRAASLAKGHTLAFTDADCSVGPDWLRSIHRAVQDGADLVTGPVEPPAGVSSTLRRVHEYENARMEGMCRAGAYGINYAYTNNLAIRTELFRTHGGFNESKGRGGDSELVLRALASGMSTMAYERDMRAVHLEVDTLRRWWFKKYLYGRSGTANRSNPSVAAFRSSHARGADAATIGALGIGRVFYELGRAVSPGRRQ
jgi:GT2 family glycosyltransferase